MKNKAVASLVMLAFASIFAFGAGSSQISPHRVGFALLTAASIAGLIMVHAQHAHGLVRTLLGIIAIVGMVSGTGYIFIR